MAVGRGMWGKRDVEKVGSQEIGDVGEGSGEGEGDGSDVIAG